MENTFFFEYERPVFGGKALSMGQENGSVVRGNSGEMINNMVFKYIHPFGIRESSVQPGCHKGLPWSVICPGEVVSSVP